MTFLVQGKIPPNTECIFRAACPDAQSNSCAHRGIEHQVPFSCGYARAFEIFGRDKEVVDNR